MSDSGETILVVDDDPANREVVSTWLGKAGYATETATNGQEALERVGKGGINLVVLDVAMPVMDGFEALGHLREDHAMTELPILILSAKEETQHVVEAMRLGANDYAIKPVDLHLLLDRVRTHLKLKTGQGTVIGKWRISGKLGSGGMGVVYSAVDDATGEVAALKILPRSVTIEDRPLKRFMREARLAARVDHPNLVRILQVGHDDDIHFIAMELVKGQNLREWRELGRIDLAEALGIATQMIDGVEALHEAGIIHRDVKPENVILTADGLAKLTDLGIARETCEANRLTREGVGLGSILYAAPEQLHGSGDVSSDLYSLGATLFYLFTGEDPFPLDEELQRSLLRKERAPPLAHKVDGTIPRSLSRVIARMMEPDPSKRLLTCAAARAALARVRDTPVGVDPVLGRGPRLAVALGVGLAAFVALLWLLSRC